MTILYAYSYAYTDTPQSSAPALGSRSPPKVPSSPFRSRVQGEGEEAEVDNDGNENDGALSRFARLKQQQQQHQNHVIATTPANSTTTTTTNREKDFSTRPGGPKVITSPPKPERWSVKDTSVNIATAFTQAASGSGASAFGEMSAASSSYTHTHNHNWASTSRTPIPVPRSTSVEYEAAAAGSGLGSAGQGAGGQPKRALPAPPDKFVRPTTTGGSVVTRKPLSKTVSIRHVPDSEGEEDQPSTTTTTNNVRGKSPFEHSLQFAKHALGAAAYYVRHRSKEPEERSVVNGGHDESYDYAAEEQAYQAQKRVGTTSTPSVTTGAAHRRNRMSVDNKAYKPSQESEEEDDDVWSDTKRRKRRGGKGGPAGGPLLTLPVVKADKRRRRKKGTLGSLGDEEGDSGSDDGDNVCLSFFFDFLDFLYTGSCN